MQCGTVRPGALSAALRALITILRAIMVLGSESLTGHIPRPNPTRSSRERLAWYWARTTQMDAREIVHRLMEAVTKQFSRGLAQGWDALKPIGGPLVSLPGIADLACNCETALAAEIAREAEDVKTGRFHLLGIHWPVPGAMPPPPAFWHVDPDDGEVFPQRDAYCFDVSFRHGVNTREIKRIWELSRLQFLVPLAAYATLTGGPEEAELVDGVVRSWMDGNHPYRGLNWSSGIELALRVISVALALSITGVERLDEPSRQAMLKFFAAHVYWLKRFPSLYSSANNHRVAELAGLIVGVTMAPGLSDEDDLRQRSWRELLVELDRQIHPDGVGAEQAPTYTAFAIELFLVAALACGKLHDLPAATKDRLAAWAEYSLWFMDTQAKTPAIGDTDDGRVIATTQAREPRYIASIVSAVASCLGRPDLAPPTTNPSLRDVLFGSTEPAPVSRTGLRTFPTGGYSVFRGKGENPAVLTFDHGPVGYLSIAAHGHADTLAVWLSIGNQRIFADAGTFRYHSRKALRDAYRHTAMHNTLTLRGQASSCPSGPFNWATKAKGRCLARADSPVACVTAEHDGYLARFGLKHRRTVAYDGISEFTVTDELLGVSDERDATISFLLDPSCTAAFEEDGSLLIGAGGPPLVRLASAGLPNVSIIRGDEHSNLGWVSPSFGVRVPADQILLSGVLRRPSVVTITLLS